jgi:hypothetical protein
MAIFRLPPIAEIDGASSGWGFFLCAQKDLRPTKTGGSYLSLMLQDATGEIAAKVFDGAESLNTQFNKGDFVKVQARGNTFKQQVELVLENIRRVNPARMPPTVFAKKTAFRVRRGRSPRCGRSCRIALPR